MHSIFFKILFWFWVTLVLMGLTSFVVVATTKSDNFFPHEHVLHSYIANSLKVFSQTSIEVMNEKGQDAFNSYLAEIEKNMSAQVTVFDRLNNTIYGQTITSEDFELLSTQKYNLHHLAMAPGKIMVQHTITATNGNDYCLIWQIKLAHPRASAINLVYLVIRLLAVTLAAGTLCYWLSRYLTKPIINLRSVVHQLASGDLTARVGSSIGNRKDEIADLGKDFDLMAERLCSLIDSQKRLISDVSHELRSPLARLNVALTLARKRAGEKAISALDRIELESERLNILIEQLLTLARLESNKEVIETKAIKLDQLVQDVVADADFEAQSTQRSVVISSMEKISLVANEELLRRAIENVLRNAIRYTPVDTEVEVSLTQEKFIGTAYAVIRVRDHGEGVPEKALKELFRPFYRIADARDRQSGGAGLGLAIVEKAIKAHKGEVSASNTIDGGLLVEIRLPI